MCTCAAARWGETEEAISSAEAGIDGSRGGSYLQEPPACAGLPRLLLPRQTANEARGWDLPELPQAPPGLLGHIPCGMWLGEGHKSLYGHVGPRHAPIHVCCVAGGPAASAVERLAWLSQGVFGQPGAGKVMSAVTISSASAAGMTLLLFCHWESQRTSPMSLCDAKMLPESPPCPLGCSNAILRATKVICFGEFYLCKCLAVFHGIHIS